MLFEMKHKETHLVYWQIVTFFCAHGFILGYKPFENAYAISKLNII